MWYFPDYSGLLIIRGKKVEFRGIFGDKFVEKTADFAGISREFSGQTSPKNKEEIQEERVQKKKDIGRMSNSVQERKHNSSSNTVLKAIVLVSSYKKTQEKQKLYRNGTAG